MAGPSVVRDLGLFVELTADAVSDQLPDDPVVRPRRTFGMTAAPMSPTWFPGTVGLHRRGEGPGSVTSRSACASSAIRLRPPKVRAESEYQPSRLHPDVDRDDVSLDEDTIVARNAVDDLFVHRDAGTARESRTGP